MNLSDETPDQPNDGAYQVVALRYRPQTFEDLVGQDHISQALSNALAQNRVGHAYLFTGARGVGKTSSARIFAKCLNCKEGPTPTPCGKCDICESIAAGDDIDVIEIDGASNRGIDEIRQLRANVAVRPSRSKFKIYIIDEVHMLTTPAFNALLKTLEEPPGHVKFIFCTTDPQKIPITVLSRCQRYDFSPVQTTEIAKRLLEIANAENVEIDTEALTILARKAGGSMRDSQSLLEQLLSFCDTRITTELVHELLGTADVSRIADIANALVNHAPADALACVHSGVISGIDPGQLAEQLLGYFRDMMAVRVGCNEETLLTCSAPDLARLTELSEKLGLESVLMIVQMLDTAVVGMQSSLHARTLLEVALIRVCNLENLDSISDLVNSLSKSGTRKSGTGKSTSQASIARARPRTPLQQVEIKTRPTDAPSKKNEITESATSASDVRASATSPPTTSSSVIPSSVIPSSNTPASNTPASNTPAKDTPPSVDMDASNIEKIWNEITESMDDLTADMASDYEKLELADPGHLIVTLNDTVGKDLCSKPERKRKFESALERITGGKIRIDFLASNRMVAEHAPTPKLTRVQQIRKLQEEEFVQQTMSLFGAEITRFYQPQDRTRR